MDKINIANILSIPENEVVGPVGIYTNNKSVRTTVDDVLKINKERHDNKLKLYRIALRECVRKIEQQNILRKTETFYKFDDIVFGHPEYDKDECIEYVLIELKKFLFDVCQIDDSIIYISWKFTELHKKSQFFTDSDKNV